MNNLLNYCINICPYRNEERHGDQQLSTQLSQDIICRLLSNHVC